MSNIIRTDNLSPEDRRRTMQKVRDRDTSAEMIVRRLVYQLGYRYRLHRRDLPGKPDLVFMGRRKIVFVHGCFWHGHDCKSGRKQPKTNSDYWSNKLRNNKQRDVKNREALESVGWKVLVVWECETKDVSRLQQRLVEFLEGIRL